MARRSSVALSYPALLAPWQTLASDSSGVIALRLTLMPWLWMFDPAAARRESNTMVDEKKAAFAETQLALWSAPWRFWFDMASGGPLRTPTSMIADAMLQGTRRLAAPSQRRVGANRRRLAGTGR